MIEETDSQWDRTFLDLSSKLAEPFCWAYGMVRYRSISPLDPNKFDNTSSKVAEVAMRALIFSCAALAMTFAGTHIMLAAVFIGAIGSKVFRAAGFALQKDRYTHIAGRAPEKVLSKGEARVMTWSLCGEFWGLHYREGGVVHWRSRIDRIVDAIAEKDPDVIVLQDIKDTALAEALIAKLQERYAHFFTHIGGSTWESTNGHMVITKCAVASFSVKELEDQTRFEIFSLKANPKDKTPCVRFIATDLAPGKENRDKRMEQVAQIVDHLAKEKLSLPTLFVGSNAKQDDLEEGAFLSRYLYHSYRGKEPTSTDQLAMQWDPEAKEQGELYDFISLVKRNLPDGRTLPVKEKNIRLLACEIVEGFTKELDTSHALSNHHGVVTTFSGVK